ncbi:hypothetical protein DFH08DRAFT_157608 [Mycena albidolilacea]|uniref:Nephrocystin 3-like N-terminal domain-containing protein n=1 Tax=Mycena albidolilacea TaxID=1033008 RepID=A0AAD7A2F0_9AGAR|nr:hypothetical protein DFH08DRAFT_157608 [Mycena albidolilacea]
MTGEARDTGEAGYGNPRPIQHIADDQSAGVIRTQRRVPRHYNQPYGLVEHRYHNAAEESQDHHFIGWPPFPNSQGIPANSYRVGGNMTQLQVTSYGESGLDILYHFIAMGATHDSGERFAEPACHPGTRIAVLEQLSAWANDQRPESSILWLHGPAGMGKSAIAQMFAGNCKNSGRLGASFFFKRGDPERGSWHRLFSTLAYQLAYSVSGLLLHVQRAVEANKLVVNQAKELQFQRLIVETLQQAPMPEVLPVLVLDGLDECEDPKIQQNILRLFIDAIHMHQLPIRILIASRPELHIHGVFQTNATFNICRLMELSADKTAYEDIRKYLHNEFSRIRAEYFAYGIDLGDMWPPPEDLESLVKKSSGIFIYPATVIRFIGDLYSGSHPQERLNSVLSLDPESTAPLDDLYTQILSVVKCNVHQLRILHVIWQSKSGLSLLGLDPEEIDLLLDLHRGSSRLALHCLHSLLKVPPIVTRFGFRQLLEVFHASFPDFLGDPRRSKGWCVALPWLYFDLLHCMIRLLSSPPSTACAAAFYRGVIGSLPKILSNATPCDQLFNLLRNTVFQNSLFLQNELSSPWPQRGSEYPTDLIQLWECHQFISALTKNLENFSPKKCSPTFKYDHLYTWILSGQSTLIFILSTQARLGLLGPILRLFDLSYRVFEPFFAFHKRLELPFPAGDSPLDFIADPDRAGPLYMRLQVIAETVVLRWIVRAREFVIAGDFLPSLLGPHLFQPDIPFQQPSGGLLKIIKYCRPSSKILNELAALDLSKICDQISDDQVHKDFHEQTLWADGLLCIVNWLQVENHTHPGDVTDWGFTFLRPSLNPHKK